MQETRKFIEAIQARASGRPHDFTLYFSTVERCARAVYRKRLGWASVPDEKHEDKTDKDAIKGKGRHRREEVPDIAHPDVVDELPFIDTCWEWMERGLPVRGPRKKRGKEEYWKAGDRMGKLLLKLANTYYPSDKDVEQYLVNCFSNQLETMITEMTPGLDALKRQVDRVMKSFGIQDQDCWVLGDAAAHSAPATRETLRNAAKTIPYPKYSIRKTKDGGFSRSIRDSEFKIYLRKLLEKCGGKVREADLIDHARDLLNLWIRRETGPIDDEKDDKGVLIEEIAGHDGPEIGDLLIAKEIHGRLLPLQKRLLRERYIDGLTPAQLAKKYRCKEATISNRFKKIKGVIGTYYEESGNVSHDDRLDSVLRIVIGLCRKEGSR